MISNDIGLPKLWQAMLAERIGPSEWIKSYGVAIAGVVALSIAIWRAFVADRNSRTAESAHQREIERMDFDRFQRGAESLGSEKLTVRVGAIVALADLAKSPDQKWRSEIYLLLFAFLRQRSSALKANSRKAQERQLKLSSEDLAHATRALLEPPLRDLKKRIDFSNLYFAGAPLQNTRFRNVNLNQSNFAGASLQGASFENVSFIAAVFSHANISKTKWTKTNAAGATFGDFSNFSDAEFRHVHLVGASFRLVNTGTAKFVNCQFGRNDVSGADFSNTKLAPLPAPGSFVAWASARPGGIDQYPLIITLIDPKFRDTNSVIHIAPIADHISWQDAEAKYPDDSIPEDI